MNIIFLTIKIIDFKFNFSLKKKQNSICNINGILIDNSKIKLIAYDEQADKCLRILEKGKNYIVEGKLNSNLTILLKSIIKI